MCETRATSRIPRVIHYCWFGGASKPDIVVRCIESWRAMMPGWYLKEWNESNYDVAKTSYTRGAYGAKKWAFVSDYARFDILRQFGGVYFDTDVELLRPIPEPILQEEAFTGFESAGYVSPGLVFGCRPGFALLDEILESYEAVDWKIEARQPLTVNKRVTGILERHGLVRDDRLQRIEGLAVYPSEYFCGYDQDVHQARVTNNTVSVHHYAYTWGGPCNRVLVKIQRTVHRVVGDKVYRHLLAAKRRVLGVRGS
ncbi:MAG: glycosyltransferase [Anaerosomatales bacterium]|nr:glycosyltransferase [Anaerosomatales bacterium]